MSEYRFEAGETLDEETGAALAAEARAQAIAKGDSVVVGLSATAAMDTRGGAWLLDIGDYVQGKGGEFRWEGQTGPVAEQLALIEPALHPEARAKAVHTGLVERTGASTIAAAKEFRQFFDLLIEAIYWTIIGPLTGKRIRWGLLLDEMHEMGVKAVKVNFTMNFLLGLTIAMLSAAQVQPLGLGIYVADLVVIGFARELAALMTAIVVSARTGAAITAELATMKVQEEIDALRGMGVNVTQYLVAPKLLSLLFVMPVLAAIGLIAGVLGGAFWGIIVLGFAPTPWILETRNAMDMGDFTQGTVKALTFAVIIALVGCHNGLRATGGSRGVGLMTTRAVVLDIFFIVLVDMIFAGVFYYMD